MERWKVCGSSRRISDFNPESQENTDILLGSELMALLIIPL